MKLVTCLPRLIRLRDAPNYLGMDRHRFNLSVRPGLTQVRIGVQGVAFDRLELDAWVDNIKAQIKKTSKKFNQDNESTSLGNSPDINKLCASRSKFSPANIDKAYERVSGIKD